MPVSQLIVTSNSDDQKKIVISKITELFGNQHKPEIIWINDDEEPLKIKDVRSLTESLSYATSSSAQRAIVLLRVESASTPAQNALLKLVEEPPPRTTVILTTTRTDAVLPTILSRCVLSHAKKTTTGKNQPHINLDPFLQSFAKNPKKTSYAEIILFVEKRKDRQKAREFLLFQLEQQNLPTVIRKKLLDAYRAIEGNGNVQLTLEHALFSSKKALESTAS